MEEGDNEKKKREKRIKTSKKRKHEIFVLRDMTEGGLVTPHKLSELTTTFFFGFSFF